MKLCRGFTGQKSTITDRERHGTEHPKLQTAIEWRRKLLLQARRAGVGCFTSRLAWHTASHWCHTSTEMPSNQPPRPLTRPHHRSKSGGQPFLVAASPYVLRANRFLTFFSVCFLAFTFLFTLRSADQIESYARGGKDKIGKYATSHLSPSGIKCNPFRLPGWIEKGAPSQLPVWRTFSRDCAGVNRLSLLAQSGNAASNIPALAPLQNQTILILSDAIPNQNKLTSLCGIIGEAKTGRVDIGHPWGGILQSHKEYDPQGHGLGSYCYVPSIE